MRIVTDFPRRVQEEETWIPMADGTRLAARIWRPVDADRHPVPAILEYLPYRKRDLTAERDVQSHAYWAGHGYAGVRVDIRGTGESDGVLTDEYLPQELEDGLAILEWLEAQNWCTGDVGMIDTNGFLYLLDRNNDMIVSGGFNIYPTEIENVIADHPGVLEVAVFGVPHEKWGETPLAMVRVKPGAQITETEIIDLVRQRLGSAKKPSKVVFTAEPLPLSNVGKVLRSKLREPYWAGQDRRISGA